MIFPVLFSPLLTPSPWREREVGEFIHRTGCTISVYRNVSDKREKTVDRRYISATHEFFLRLFSDFFFFLILVIHRFLSCLRKRVFHRCACGRGCREPSRRLRLVCAPSLPLHCKYIMPQTHCNCTECWSSSLFLFSLCYWRHKSCGGKKLLYDFVFLRLAPVVGLFFFFACPLWWEHFTFAATQCWLSFPSQSCLLLLLPLYIERVTPSFIFYFFFPPISFTCVGEARELETATVHPCIWRAARLGLDCVGLVNSERKKIVMQCLCLWHLL